MSIAISVKRICLSLLTAIYILGCAAPVSSPVTGSLDEADPIALNDALNESDNETLASSTSQTASDDKILSTLASGDVDAEIANLTSNSSDLIAAALGSPQLVGLSLEQKGRDNNIVVAEVTSAGTYMMQKTAPSEHVVTLEDATIAPAAMRTLVSPPQSGLIRSVRAVQDGSNVLLRVFSHPDAELTAQAISGKIVISAKEGTQNGSGPLAQLSDEVPAVDTKAEKAAKAVAADVAKVEAAKTEAAKTDTAATTEPEVVATSEVPAESDISALLEGEPKYTGRLISLDLQDTDIDNALRIIAEVSDLNIITSDNVSGKVTLRLIDVPWDQALDVILKTNGLDKVQEGNVVRVAPVEKLRTEREALKEAQRADEDLQPLLVRYIRISYAKASEVKPLVEAVLSERGAVAVDSRTNQIIVKDIQKGIQNVVELVQKLDLRTPQVLLETQIVEANRNFLRDLGSEVGFSFVRSPEIGNATGYNFPNSVAVAGAQGAGNTGSSFPAAVTGIGSAVSALFESADGSKTLALRLSSAEKEGRVRIVSRPSVATINNKKATIKSVEKIRVKTPDSGLSVATGEGASSSGGSAVATETFEVGIVLDVVPQASPDYYVLLDINAKSSTLGSQQVDGIPSEIERSATSTILVSSGQTFALGGIYKIKDSDNIDGVPFFKDMPVFGQFFRRNLVDNSDEELIFFITPRIVEGSFDDAAMKSSL